MDTKSNYYLFTTHKSSFKRVSDNLKVNESRIAPLPYRESRCRQGFGRGKSITYGRLSPPLSAFNHTLCEQNIKTCPFVCRRRFVALKSGRNRWAIFEATSVADGRADTGGRRRSAIRRVYFEQSFARCSYKEVRICTALWGRLAYCSPPWLTLLHCYRSASSN